MKTLGKTIRRALLLTMAALWALCLGAAAESGDNSLYSLGLENAESCSPEFYYSTLEYDVTVQAGTTELLLDPVTSDSSASIIDISGTTLENGAGTVYITVEAPNGAQVTYTLRVTSVGEAATEAQTEAAATASAEELEQQAQESEEALRQQAENESNKAAVQTLTTENNDLNSRLDLLMKVLYGLIAFAVILLFFVINQSLRNKDLKDDLKEAKAQAEAGNEFARKEQNMQNGYYYVHGQNRGMQQAPQAAQPIGGNYDPAADISRSVQAAFGNAPQTLHAQSISGQQGRAENVWPTAEPVKETPVQEVKVAQEPKEETPVPAEKTAPQAAEAVQEPTLVQGEAKEPDIQVEMIEL